LVLDAENFMRVKYTPELKNEICRMLSAGLSTEEISEKCSVPESMVGRVSREMGVAQNKAIVLQHRSITDLMALPPDEQGEYFEEVSRKAALKAVAILDTMPGEALISNHKSVIALMRWAKDVLAPVAGEGGGKTPLLTLGRIFEGKVTEVE
jgi:hypothetical protein